MRIVSLTCMHKRILTPLRMALVAMLLGIFAVPTFAQQPDPRAFRSFIDSLRPIAEQRGISRATFDAALGGVQFDNEVANLSRRQPEYGRAVGDYLASMVAASRITGGQRRMVEYKGLLDSIAHRYGVDPAVIVAIWGIETSFGANQGGKRVIPALATLAYLRYKGDFAQNELLTALSILQEGHIPPARMIGSWAGAMGQPQFIASSFMRWAVDFDGDGRRDLWTSVPDVLASIANYLREHGWQSGQRWGHEVIVPRNFDLRRSRGTFAQFAAAGLRRADGGALSGDVPAILFFPSGARGPAFLVTRNFDVIKTYNISDVYALAVLHLADRIRGGKPFAGQWPKNDVQLSREDRMRIQKALAARGYRMANTEGMIDFDQRDAIRETQALFGMIPDGHPTPEFVRRLAGG